MMCYYLNVHFQDQRVKSTIRSISAKTFMTSVAGNLYVKLLFETVQIYDMKQQQADCTTFL